MLICGMDSNDMKVETISSDSLNCSSTSTSNIVGKTLNNYKKLKSKKPGWKSRKRSADLSVDLNFEASMRCQTRSHGVICNTARNLRRRRSSSDLVATTKIDNFMNSRAKKYMQKKNTTARLKSKEKFNCEAPLRKTIKRLGRPPKMRRKSKEGCVPSKRVKQNDPPFNFKQANVNGVNNECTSKTSIASRVSSISRCTKESSVDRKLAKRKCDQIEQNMNIKFGESNYSHQSSNNSMSTTCHRNAVSNTRLRKDTTIVKVLLKNMSPNHIKLKTMGLKSPQEQGDEAKMQEKFLQNASSVPVFSEINVKYFEGYVQICICPRTVRRARCNPLGSTIDGFPSRPKSNAEDRSPRLYNCLTPDMLEELCIALESAQQGPCRAVLLRSVGKIFCAGLDLHYILYHARERHKEELSNTLDGIRKFVDCLIHFNKPIVAAVQGPAVGLGAALLCLCDIVLAEEGACFHMPYPQQGLTPDGCTSYLLPNLIGPSLANSVLYGNRTLTAYEACKSGLFSEILPRDSFNRHVIPRVRDVCASSLTALRNTKHLLRSNQLQQLVYANECENRALRRCFSSSECLATMHAYAQQHVN